MWKWSEKSEMWARSKTRVKIWKLLFSSLIFANTQGVHKCDFSLSSFLLGAKYDESCQGSCRREPFSPTSKMPVMWGGIHDNRPIQGDIMPYYSRVYPAWPLESSKTPRKLWHTRGSLYVPVYKVKPFLNALSFWWKLRITIFNIQEQLQSFHFKVCIHVCISCTGCLLAETWKQKVLFSNVAKVKLKFCCVKWWKTKNPIYVKVLTKRFLFEWSHGRICPQT